MTTTTVTHRKQGRIKCRLCNDTGVVEKAEAKYLGTITTATGKRIPVRGPRTMVYREVCDCKKGGAS